MLFYFTVLDHCTNYLLNFFRNPISQFRSHHEYLLSDPCFSYDMSNTLTDTCRNCSSLCLIGFGNYQANLLDCFIKLILATPCDKNKGAFLDEPSSSSKAHPAISACDDCSFSFKSFCNYFSFES